MSARTPTSPPVIESQYRYVLRRSWNLALDEDEPDDPGPPAAVWVMLNPSTADDTTDDPTIRRVMAFSKEWGCGGCIVLNLFAMRATQPSALVSAADPVGPANDQTLADWFMLVGRGPLVAAWGAINDRRLRGRVGDVLRLCEHPWLCLGTTLDGSPRHPLYVRADAELEVWRP